MVRRVKGRTSQYAISGRKHATVWRRDIACDCPGRVKHVEGVVAPPVTSREVLRIQVWPRWKSQSVRQRLKATPYKGLHSVGNFLVQAGDDDGRAELVPKSSCKNHVWASS